MSVTTAEPLAMSGRQRITVPPPQRVLQLPDLSRHDTTVKLLVENARRDPDGVALREKEFGIWQAITWTQYRDRVRAMALGLAGRGAGPGQVIGLIGDNRPFWVMGELACHALRAMSIGLYRDVLEDELIHLLGHSGAEIVLAEDEEQVEKLLAVSARVPALRLILYADPRGLRKYDDPRLLALSVLEAEGAAAHAADPQAFDRLVAATRTEDVAILCTTSGTTSAPKLAMLSHRSLLNHAARYLEADPKDSRDEYLASLPLPWIMEQLYSIAFNLLARMKVNFAEEPETTAQDLREIGPTFVLLAPRTLEQMAADIRARMMDAGWLKRRLFDWGSRLGMQAVARGRSSRLSRLLVMNAVRDQIGLTRVVSAATGGAALGPDTFRFFLAMGLPLRQLYGQTELLGAYTLHPPEAVDLDTVGTAFRGVQLRIDQPDADGLGEIVTRHDFMMQGYYRNDAATAESFDAEGWMRTGDAGYVTPDGQLVVIDRVKDLASMRDGRRFSPQFIENKLKFSPYVGEAVILGRGEAYLSAIICIRFSIVSKWAERQRINFTTYSDLSAKKPVQDLLKREVEAVNQSLPEHQRIRRFLLLYKELDADDGELTRTRKVRRGVVAEKYSDIIQAIYAGQSAIPIDTVIRFQDGTTQRVVTTLTVLDLAG